MIWADFYVDLTNHGLRQSISSNPVDPIQPRKGLVRRSCALARLAKADVKERPGEYNTEYIDGFLGDLKSKRGFVHRFLLNPHLHHRPNHQPFHRQAEPGAGVVGFIGVVHIGQIDQERDTAFGKESNAQASQGAPGGF